MDHVMFIGFVDCNSIDPLSDLHIKALSDLHITDLHSLCLCSVKKVINTE